MSELSWDKVSFDIARVNNRLYNILRTIDGIENMLFTVLEYEYGQIIADEEYFYLPNQNGKLTSVPFSMVLEKRMEMFIEFRGKSSTHQVYKEGDFFSVSSLYNASNTHHPTDILQISSGARNTFLLSPVADARPHASLEKYFKATIPVPHELESHYLTFSALCKAANSPWRSKLLVFPSEIVKSIKENKLPELLSLIMEFDSNQTGYYANLPFYNYLMAYIRANNQEITQNEFANNAISQLIAIGAGQVPGYGLAVNDDLLPLHFIQDVYRDIYKTKYTPFIMEPVHFIKRVTSPVFYSIVKEEMAFKPSSFSNKPQRCELIYETYYQYVHDIKKLGHFKNTPFFESATMLELTLFHEKKNQVTNSLFKLPKDAMFNYDPRFLEQSNMLGFSKEQFPSKTTFLVGCFGIK
ncbi:hypothetical protein Lbir_1958 [Legionella birminghamensis]|uniref:Uncharacterized protein n=1 Tax=Legionella birminghamensis TaxID=28083 RepID=A0A378JSE6_9GAMM|nr:hypothetical protein [Legionella birminghamensis]KTC69818.1 hypothetical protein Lbir_1958 [Legionella birminghamensis]STX60910.1 Uncharacterised protein [Legionella birminghamensis]